MDSRSSQFKAPLLKKAMLVSLVVGSILTVVNQWDALINDTPVKWIPVLLTYLVPFLVFILGSRQRRAGLDANDIHENMSGVAPEHIEALYRQAMIVEKNAHKANAAFGMQLKNIRGMAEKTRRLEPGVDFDQAHNALVDELAMLEQRVEKILKK